MFFIYSPSVIWHRMCRWAQLWYSRIIPFSTQLAGWKWKFLITIAYRNLQSCDDALQIAGRGHRVLSNNMPALALVSKVIVTIQTESKTFWAFWDTFGDRTATKPTFPRAARSLVFQCTVRFVGWTIGFNGSRSMANKNFEGEKQCDICSKKFIEPTPINRSMKQYWNAGLHKIHIIRYCALVDNLFVTK